MNSVWERKKLLKASQLKFYDIREKERERAKEFLNSKGERGGEKKFLRASRLKFCTMREKEREIITFKNFSTQFLNH